jgi:tRNA(Ile)-lysidine synthase
MAVSRIRARPEPVLAARVAAVLEEAGVGAGSRLCVALSGGVDSVVLLHVLAGLRYATGFSLSAAHVHHGLSPHAEHWLEHCARLCEVLSVPFTPLRVMVERGHADGLEAAARTARHAALSSLPADWLLFAHHQDDQAETVLFRLLRGAGVRGAAAMASIESGRLRPLLGTRRTEIVAYARDNALAWVEDESNADSRHARSRLRHEVMPSVAAAFPAASAMLEDLAALDAAACGGERLRVAALQALSEPRLRNLIRSRIHMLGLDAPPRARLIEAMRQLRDSDGVSLYLPLGAAACCVHRGEVWVERQLAALPEALRWQGQAELPWANGRVVFHRATSDGLSLVRLQAAGDVVVGTRCEGLRMRTAVGRPHHSFKNLCQEFGVPTWLRGHLPVLYLDGEPVWIAGVGIAPEFACQSGESGLRPQWVRS